MMEHPAQVRVMSNGPGWYWEVVTCDRDVVARGLADTHAQASTEAEQRILARFYSLRVSVQPFARHEGELRAFTQAAE